MLSMDFRTIGWSLLLSTAVTVAYLAYRQALKFIVLVKKGTWFKLMKFGIANAALSLCIIILLVIINLTILVGMENVTYIQDWRSNLMASLTMYLIGAMLGFIYAGPIILPSSIISCAIVRFIVKRLQKTK